MLMIARHDSIEYSCTAAIFSLAKSSGETKGMSLSGSMYQMRGEFGAIALFLKPITEC